MSDNHDLEMRVLVRPMVYSDIFYFLQNPVDYGVASFDDGFLNSCLNPESGYLALVAETERGIIGIQIYERLLYRFRIFYLLVHQNYLSYGIASFLLKYLKILALREERRIFADLRESDELGLSFFLNNHFRLVNRNPDFFTAPPRTEDGYRLYFP